MKEEDVFDRHIRNKINSLEQVPGLDRDENQVWDKIEPQINSKPKGNLYLITTILFLILIGIGYTFLNNKALPIKQPKKQNWPVQKSKPIVVKKVQESKVPADTGLNRRYRPQRSAVLQTNRPSIVAKKTKNIPASAEINHPVESNKVLVSDSSFATNELKENDKSVQEPTLLVSTVDRPGSLTKAKVHVYRQNHLSGAAYSFTLKANEQIVGRIKNNSHQTLELAPGQTIFEINNKEIKINLKAGKHYYLRVSLTRNGFAGKPELLEVPESTYVAEYLSTNH